ncbi:MAG: N-acetylmuramoyl-L-alanine amidase, partial [Vicinamibacterales bacterium]
AAPPASTPTPAAAIFSATRPPAATPAGASASASPATLVTVKAIRRAVLKDIVRIVIELDAEIAFHDERLENPNRVFIDLQSTRANPALIDQTLRFDADTDVVRQIRIGRHPNSITRVVLETAGVSSYSVYPLYSPYRLVIDCLRELPVASIAAHAPAPVPPTVLPVPRSLTAAPMVLPATPALRQTIIEPPIPVAALNLDLLAAPPSLAPRRIAALSTLAINTLSATADPTPAQSIAVPPAPVIAPKPAAAALAAPPARNVAGGLSLARQLGLGVSRIVIDPGHGGHDPGAKGGGINEAELVLDIALRLEKLLTRLPGVDVVLTRRENTFIPLQERTAIANRENADLFLSIHANASPVPAARGIETYFLNFASNQNAAAVAARENATSEQTMGALQDVVKAIALNSKRDESRDFATYVQREMLDSLRSSNKTLKDLGVKQAPFVVLIGASMPSVLAEISFLTNPQEAKLLKGSSYRQKIAQALFEGVRDYQNSLKRVPAVAQQQN